MYLHQYDNQQDFKVDANKVADFCARRLGYPLAEVELQSGSFFTAFEEAVTTYGNELYAYKVRENYLSLEGSSTLVESNEKIIEPNFAGLVRITEQYGEEADFYSLGLKEDEFFMLSAEHNRGLETLRNNLYNFVQDFQTVDEAEVQKGVTPNHDVVANVRQYLFKHF